MRVSDKQTMGAPQDGHGIDTRLQFTRIDATGGPWQIPATATTWSPYHMHTVRAGPEELTRGTCLIRQRDRMVGRQYQRLVESTVVLHFSANNLVQGRRCSICQQHLDLKMKKRVSTGPYAHAVNVDAVSSEDDHHLPSARPTVLRLAEFELPQPAAVHCERSDSISAPRAKCLLASEYVMLPPMLS